MSIGFGFSHQRGKIVGEKKIDEVKEHVLFPFLLYRTSIKARVDLNSLI